MKKRNKVITKNLTDIGRIEWIDCLKALACIFVVIVHILNECIGEDAILARIISLFHMPLFFMISGITYTFSKANNISNIKLLLLKREVNLWVPVVVFTIINVVFGNDYNIFNYYNGVWYIVFLAFIILGTVIIEYFNFNRYKKYVYMMITVFWLFFGILQIVFIHQNNMILAKFACEISKFWGYFISFHTGMEIIQNKERFEKIKKREIDVASLIFVIIMISSFLLKLDGNIALTRIVCGILGGGILIAVYSTKRKSCFWIEKQIAKYSLEIYLIHVNIIHGILLPLLPYDSLSGLMRVGATLVLFAMDFLIPLLIAFAAKKIKILDFIFHASKYLIRNSI